MRDQSWKMYFSVVSSVISIFGIIANCLSLSYFIKKQYKRLGDRLLMLLNSCDLMVCVVFIISAIFKLIFDLNLGFSMDTKMASYYGYVGTHAIFDACFDVTGFATCLISVTRTIKVCDPFFSIKGSWVAASFLLYSVHGIAKETTYACWTFKIWNDDGINWNYDIFVLDNYFRKIRSSTISLSVLAAVFISTMITSYWLLNKNKIQGTVSESNRHATVTIQILSTVFCLLNVTVVLSLVFSVSFSFSFDAEQWFPIFRYIAWNVLICLNSAVNPVIYLSRKQEMRQHVSETWSSLVIRFRTRPRDNGLYNTVP